MAPPDSSLAYPLQDDAFPPRCDLPRCEPSPTSLLSSSGIATTCRIGSPVHIYFFKFFLADCKAASGVALPLVAISSAAFIELQNLPIWGMLGITTPLRAFSYVPLIKGFPALISSARAFNAGTPSGASESIALRPSTVQTYCSRKYFAKSVFGLERLMNAVRTPTNGFPGLPPTPGSGGVQNRCLVCGDWSTPTGH